MRNRKTDIEKYLRGELTPAEMHALEKAALSDPFLAEALEGVEQTGADNFLYDLHRINRSVHDRARKRSIETRKTIRMWGWTSAIAATLLLIAVSGFIVINLLKDQRAREQVMDELAMVKNDADGKDTVIIPLPHEVHRAPVVAEQATQKDVSGPQQPAVSQTEIREQVDESQVKPAEQDQEQAQQELLALNESQRRAERETQEENERRAREEAALRVENRPVESGVATAEKSKAADKPRDASTKAERKIAGAQSRAAAEMPSAPARLLRGKVVSTADGSALPGVNVMIKGTTNGTVTDAEGNYQLPLPGDGATVQFSFIGYETREYDVTDSELNVQLGEDVSTLSEVVVAGYSQTSAVPEDTEAFSFAEPEGGRSDFRNYLDSAVRYPQEAIKNKAEGRVTVRFTVQPNGTLTDFQVLRGIGHGCDEELIRAIKDGPGWTPSKKGDRPLPDQVKVRFKFELPR